MSRDRLDEVLHEAIAAGVLPVSASRPLQDGRPWPVVLLTAFGAWLAAIPLLAVVGMLLGDFISRGLGPYPISILVLSGAVAALRAKSVPLFVEQLAVPALLVGCGVLGYGLFRDLPVQFASVALVSVGVLLAWTIPHGWLRVLAGAAIAVLMMLIVLESLPNEWQLFDRDGWANFWIALHASVAVWGVAIWMQRAVLNDGKSAAHAAVLESLAVGSILVTLAGLAFWSGMTFLVGASVGVDLLGDIAGGLGPLASSGWGGMLLQVISATLAAGAAAWLARDWPSVRRVWCAGVALVLVALSWFMPSLGAVFLAMAVCASSGRWRIAAAAGLAAAWIVGSFYYQLSWDLATKAVLLMAAGAVLAGLAWLASRREVADSACNPEPPVPGSFVSRSRATDAGIALCALAVLAVANVGIWQKEDLIAHGQPVYIPLRPADPRSLMQGDYMRLNFAIPSGARLSQERVTDRGRPHIVAKRGERGIASLLREHDGAALAADEFLIELTPKNGAWILVTDAWFFKEGEADRWVNAQFGEFRVGADGRALLVGLRGANIEKL